MIAGQTLRRVGGLVQLKKLPYIIEYSPEAEQHLQRLTARQRKIVLDTVDRQLLNQANVETKNRKPMVKKGKPFAAIVPIRNADEETVSLTTNRKFLAIIERSRSRTKKEGAISSKELRRRLGLKK